MLKTQSGFEGRENGKEKGNQGIKEHSQIISNSFVLTNRLFRESKRLYTFCLFILFKISLPRAQFSYVNCFSMSPATKTTNRVIFTMMNYMKTIRK